MGGKINHHKMINHNRILLILIIMRPNIKHGKDREEQGKDRVADKNKVERRAANITFRDELSQFNLNALVSQHRHLIKQTQWRFSFKEFQDKNASSVLADARVLLIISLTIHYCKQPRILKELAPISFPKLVTLNLTGNKIGSLEMLQRIDLPALQNLFVRENFLTSLRSLCKCNFHLKILQISDNNIISLNGLEQLDLSCLHELWAYNNPLNLNWSLMKLHANYPKVKRIKICQTQTVSPLRFQRALRVCGVRQVRMR